MRRIAVTARIKGRREREREKKDTLKGGMTLIGCCCGLL